MTSGSREIRRNGLHGRKDPRIPWRRQIYERRLSLFNLFPFRQLLLMVALLCSSLDSLLILSSVQRQCQQRRYILHRKDLLHSTSLHAASDVTEREDLTQQRRKNVLKFQSSFQAQSNPLPRVPPNVPPSSFFDDPAHFSFGKSIPSHIVPTTPELLDEWVCSCRRVGASLPNSNKPSFILSVRAVDISILGLSLEWSALMGANIVDEGEGGTVEFVLIRDESKARGARPLLWVYNKVMDSSSSKSKRETRFLTKFGLKRASAANNHDNNVSNYQDNDNCDGCLIFDCSGSIEMTFQIPSVVGRLFPSGRRIEAAEQKVNDLITKQITRNMKESIAHWEDTFHVWIEKHI